MFFIYVSCGKFHFQLEYFISESQHNGVPLLLIPDHLQVVTPIFFMLPYIFQIDREQVIAHSDHRSFDRFYPR